MRNKDRAKCREYCTSNNVAYEEKIEVDRIARGQKPFIIECDIVDISVESGRAGHILGGLQSTVHCILECFDNKGEGPKHRRL